MCAKRILPNPKHYLAPNQISGFCLEMSSYPLGSFSDYMVLIFFNQAQQIISLAISCVHETTFMWRYLLCLTVIKSCKILNALELNFAIFSGKKEPHSYLLPIWAIQKNEPLAFLSIAPSTPWAYLHLYYSSWVQWIDKCETFSPPEFQHLESQSYEHPEHLGFSKPSQTTAPKHTRSAPAISEAGCSNVFLLSLELDSARALLTSTSPVPRQGKTSSHSEWACPCSKSQKNRIN